MGISLVLAVPLFGLGACLEPTFADDGILEDFTDDDDGDGEQY